MRFLTPPSHDPVSGVRNDNLLYNNGTHPCHPEPPGAGSGKERGGEGSHAYYETQTIFIYLMFMHFEQWDLYLKCIILTHHLLAYLELHEKTYCKNYFSNWVDLPWILSFCPVSQV